MIVRALAALSLLLLAGCVAQPQVMREGTFDRADALFDPARAIEQDWRVMPLAQDGETRTTDYRIASYQDRLSIRAEGRRSASALLLRTDFDADVCPYLEWEWRVERLQEGASLYERDKEDVAASILLVFGEAADGDAPTLRYAWTTAKVPEETIIDSPGRPGVLRSIVVQSGVESPLAWERERRDLVADYQAAFGSLPKSRVRMVALFTDNDQTQEPVIAHYGPARLLCRRG